MVDFAKLNQEHKMAQKAIGELIERFIISAPYDMSDLMRVWKDGYHRGQKDENDRHSPVQPTAENDPLHAGGSDKGE